MCSDAQIFILLGFSCQSRGSRATADSVTVLRKEEGPRKEPFIGITAP